MESAPLARLSTLDRLLPVWIAAAMLVGLGLGSLVPELNDWLDTVKVGTVSLPIAVGLLAMMYPVLARTPTTAKPAITRIQSRQRLGRTYMLGQDIPKTTTSIAPFNSPSPIKSKAR